MKHLYKRLGYKDRIKSLVSSSLAYIFDIVPNIILLLMNPFSLKEWKKNINHFLRPFKTLQMYRAKYFMDGRLEWLTNAYKTYEDNVNFSYKFEKDLSYKKADLLTGKYEKFLKNIEDRKFLEMLRTINMIDYTLSVFDMDYRSKISRIHAMNEDFSSEKENLLNYVETISTGISNFRNINQTNKELVQSKIENALFNWDNDLK